MVIQHYQRAIERFYIERLIHFKDQSSSVSLQRKIFRKSNENFTQFIDSRTGPLLLCCVMLTGHHHCIFWKGRSLIRSVVWPRGIESDVTSPLSPSRWDTSQLEGIPELGFEQYKNHADELGGCIEKHIHLQNIAFCQTPCLESLCCSILCLSLLKSLSVFLYFIGGKMDVLLHYCSVAFRIVYLQ